MDGEDVVKIVFMERFQAIKNSGSTDVDSFDDSIVFDLLGTASMFNLSEEVLDMVKRGHIYDKVAWKKIVWAQAWSLEDTLWKIEYNLQKCLDMVRLINPSPRYLTWWALSDKFPELINICETMARLVCHASLLWADDFRLKHLPEFLKSCPLCDLSATDDA